MYLQHSLFASELFKQSVEICSPGVAEAKNKNKEKI